MPHEREQVVHHLVDFLSPEESFSVADWLDQASQLIERLFSEGKQPVLCGGTGLYIDSLINPYTLDRLPVDLNLRKELEQKLEEVGKEELYKTLVDIDPASAAKIHPNNTRRVIRALEIYRLSGKSKSQLEEEGKENFDLSFTPVLFSPEMSREDLYNRINTRVDLMMKKGLLDEVETLLKKYDRNMSSLQALGYKEFYPYFDGEDSLEHCIEILKRDTRHFAKRQLTWFRRYSNINYL